MVLNQNYLQECLGGRCIEHSGQRHQCLNIFIIIVKEKTPHNNSNYMTPCDAHDNGSYSNTIPIVKVTYFSFQIENKLDRKLFKIP
jgi:hypothetical protein